MNQDDTSPTLKRCPFCGSEPCDIHPLKLWGQWIADIACQGCPVVMRSNEHGSEAEAIAEVVGLWNERASVEVLSPTRPPAPPAPEGQDDAGAAIVRDELWIVARGAIQDAALAYRGLHIGRCVIERLREAGWSPTQADAAGPPPATSGSHP